MSPGKRVPELRAELVELMEELRATGAVRQTATIVGNGNVNTQIAGNRNQVWGRGEGPDLILGRSLD